MNTPTLQNREKLKTEMMQAFQPQMQHLNKELQNMLVDDLVTAFYSRLQVMTKITKNQ
ncbi:MAG: hypothetical protein P8X87_07115 [Candidatus Bathyarchaeota archaeon]